MFREYVDETSSAWLTDARVADYLGFAYEQFRAMVNQVDPSAFLEGANLVLNGTVIEYDLALAANPTRILGSPAGGLTGPRLRQAYEIYHDDGTGRPDYYLKQARNLRQLHGFERRRINSDWQPSWWLTGTTVAFSEAPPAGTYVLSYYPESSVSWGSASTDVVDDYVAFHDLIALLAARSYMARDGLDNPALRQHIEERKAEFIQWLSNTRQPYVNDMVVDEFP